VRERDRCLVKRSGLAAVCHAGRTGLVGEAGSAVVNYEVGKAIKVTEQGRDLVI
jgi:hypothetical protein